MGNKSSKNSTIISSATCRQEFRQLIVNAFIRDCTNNISPYTIPILPHEVINIITTFYELNCSIFDSTYFTNLTTPLPQSFNNFYKNHDTYFYLTYNGMYCYGDNYYGQLGIGPPYNLIHYTEMFKSEFFIKDKIPLVISKGFLNDHLFIYTKNNLLYAMGQTKSGQFGYYSKGVTNSPCKINFNFNDQLIDIQCGLRHSLFLTSIGDVYMCGESGQEQMFCSFIPGKILLEI